MVKEDWLIVLDNGHGQETPGKRSPNWKGQPQLFEWQWARILAHYVEIKLKSLHIVAHILVPEVHDVPLLERAERANRVTALKRKTSLLVSLHGNAHGTEGANGFEVFTSPGITESDHAAFFVLEKAAETEVFKMRVDEGHPFKNKESRFTILTATKCNAILVEAGFYTNARECKYMQSVQGLNVIASIIAQGINTYITNVIEEEGGKI